MTVGSDYITKDVEPFSWCCILSEGSCHKYTSLRPLPTSQLYVHMAQGNIVLHLQARQRETLNLLYILIFGIRVDVSLFVSFFTL